MHLSVEGGRVDFRTMVYHVRLGVLREILKHFFCLPREFDVLRLIREGRCPTL